MTILLVSETTDKELLAALADSKYTIETCNFKKAPEKLKSMPVKLIILDADAKINPGLKELKKIKSKWAEIPILFITSASSEEGIIEAFRLGSRDFFKKPINTYQLKKTVANMLRLKKISQEKRSQIISRAQTVASPYDKATTSLPENILKIISYMEDHFSKEMNLEELAKKAGMSKFHFCRTFKKYLDLSPIQFLTRLRMDRAKTLLGSTHRSISDVADSVGFNDLSNFIKNFKKTVGTTPTGYRKTANKKR
jgi:YesN/AraC family two-component response regulator